LVDSGDDENANANGNDTAYDLCHFLTVPFKSSLNWYRRAIDMMPNTNGAALVPLRAIAVILAMVTYHPALATILVPGIFLAKISGDAV
jgi:hypothetical protein